MNNYNMSGDMPIGLSMALAHNIPAMESFAAMNDSQRLNVVRGAHEMRSRAEMRQYVNDLAAR